MMLSVQPPPKSKFPSELSPSALRPNGNLTPLLSPRPGSGFVVPPSPRFGAAGETLDEWFQDLQKYEKTLAAMAVASEDPKFREELGTIEQWFKLLTESEQTASLYTLLQHTNPAQIKFLMAVLQQMSDAIPPAENPGSKQTSRSSLRPPNLNLPGTPGTPHFSAGVSSAATHDSIPKTAEYSAQELVIKEEPISWANMVSTPHDLMFKKSAEQQQQAGMQNLQNLINSAGAGMGMQMNVNGMTPFNVTVLSSMGFSNEQIVAMQLVMRGLGQPADTAGINGNVSGQKNSQPHHGNGGNGQRSSRSGNSHSTSGNNSNWRSSGSRYPGSALRNGPKSAGPKSAGPKSSGLTSATSTGGTPKTEDDVDPELLKDIPAWLKSLRLHKYTTCFDGMGWQEIVMLDEPTLEAKGVTAMGARRRLTRTFEVVKKKMGMETSSPSDAPPASAAPALNGTSINSPSPEKNVPHSAAPIL